MNLGGCTKCEEYLDACQLLNVLTLDGALYSQTRYEKYVIIVLILINLGI
jgi:hypothetical protein